MYFVLVLLMTVGAEKGAFMESVKLIMLRIEKLRPTKQLHEHDNKIR